MPSSSPPPASPAEPSAVLAGSPAAGPRACTWSAGSAPATAAVAWARAGAAASAGAASAAPAAAPAAAAAAPLPAAPSELPTGAVAASGGGRTGKEYTTKVRSAEEVTSRYCGVLPEILPEVLLPPPPAAPPLLPSTAQRTLCTSPLCLRSVHSTASASTSTMLTLPSAQPAATQRGQPRPAPQLLPLSPAAAGPGAAAASAAAAGGSGGAAARQSTGEGNLTCCSLRGLEEPPSSHTVRLPALSPATAKLPSLQWRQRRRGADGCGA